MLSVSSARAGNSSSGMPRMQINIVVDAFAALHSGHANLSGNSMVPFFQCVAWIAERLE